MSRRSIVAIVAAVALGLAACGQSHETSGAATSADTLTRRQKDSIISKLPVPGARGVGAAQRAVDQTNARAQQHDTIR